MIPLITMFHLIASPDGPKPEFSEAAGKVLKKLQGNWKVEK